MKKDCFKRMESFDSRMTKAYDEYDKAMKELPKSYAGKLLVQKQTEAAKLLQSEKISNVNAFVEATNVIFDKKIDEIKKIVGTTMPSDFSATIETLNYAKHNLTDYEVELYLNKFRNNYIACKGCISIMKSVGKAKDYIFLDADFVKKELDIMRDTMNEFALNFTPHEFRNSLLVSENSPVSISWDKIKTFFDNDFLIINNINTTIGDDR